MPVTPQSNTPVSQYAAISVSSSGDNSLISGVTGKSIVVQAYKFVVASAVSVTWMSDVSTPAVALTGAMPFGGTYSPGDSSYFIRHGWFKTAAGKALNLYLSSGVAVTGFIIFVVE